MESFDGAGGNFDDIEFCDTSITDTATGDIDSVYQWWQTFSEGKRFFVPDAVRLNSKATRFNIDALTSLGNELMEAHRSHYPSCSNFGRKSFEKIIGGKAMSFPKAVLATRTINEYLKRRDIRDRHGKPVVIQRCRILMSGYRIAGFGKALGYYENKHLGHTESPSATEFLALHAGVAEFIIQALRTYETNFVVAPTAVCIIRTMLTRRDLFGIAADATDWSMLKLGPPDGISISRQDARCFSIQETGELKSKSDANKPAAVDSKFWSRTAQDKYPSHPYRRVA